MTKHEIVVKFENATIREVRNVPKHYTWPGDRDPPLDV